MILTLGMFVDGGGDDNYLLIAGDDHPTGLRNEIISDWSGLATLDFAGNGLAWTRETDRNEVPGAFGVAVDAE